MFYKNDLKPKSQVRHMFYKRKFKSNDLQYSSLPVSVCEIVIPCYKRFASRFSRWLYSELFTALTHL